MTKIKTISNVKENCTLHKQQKRQEIKETQKRLNSKKLEFINHTKKYKYIDKKTDYIGIKKKIIPKNSLSFLRSCGGDGSKRQICMNVE